MKKIISLIFLVHVTASASPAVAGSASRNSATSASPPPSAAENANFEIPKLKIYDEEVRGFLAPGLGFGPNSQEVSATIGWSAINKRERTQDINSIEGTWWSYGLRGILIGNKGTPYATNELFYFSGGGWGWEWWPFGIEIGLGGGGYSGNTYGLGEISYIIGIPGKFELTFTAQEPIATSYKPFWFSDWVVGIRYGFDLGLGRKNKITVEKLK